MIRNVHERFLPVPPALVGELLDSLAGSEDRLWPTQRWPRMRFDRRLAVGARGGHGPIRYHVESYTPGLHIRFRFVAPRGFDGYHEYAVLPGRSGTVLRHSLVMRTAGLARLSWPVLYRPLHDALIEDSLDRACVSLGVELPQPQRWGWRVRRLRALA